MRLLKVILFTVMLTGLAGLSTPAADAAHFVGVQTTPTSCVYAGRLTIDGASAVDGADEVGVFVGDGSGGEILVGAGVMGDTIAGYYYVTAYGDDPATPAKDGASNGEPLIFKVWDDGGAQEYTIPSTSMSYESYAGLTQPVIPPVWTNGVSYGLLNLEVTTGTNQPPVVSDQSFSVNESSPTGTVVGTVAASDPDGDPLSYSITGGNTGGAFSLDITSGELWVNDATQLDHATTPVYSLTVEVNDGTATDTAQVTVNVNPAGGGPPHFRWFNATPTSCVYTGRAMIGGIDGAAGIDEVGVFVSDGAGGEILVGAADIEEVQLQLANYYVTVYGDDPTTPEKDGASDNDVLTFKLWDASAGQEYLIDSQNMAYEAFTGLTQPSIPPVWTSGTTFGLLNLDTMAHGNQSPVVGDQSFSVREDGVNGDVIGTVWASDADGDALHYAITAGNTNGVFAIDFHYGQITISDASQLDAVTTPTYTLTVEVADTHQASDTATVTIDVVPSGSGSNPPVVNDQTFYVRDDVANGTLIGVVQASDPDEDPLSYSITGGNTGNAFSLDISTGELSVNDANQLDHATTPVYTLTVEVSDDTATDTAQVTINVNSAGSGAIHFSGFGTTPTSCVYTGRAVIAGMDAVDGMDEVGVFVGDGAGGEILVGAAVFGDVQPDHYFVTVYGDDPETQEKDGASDNDTLTFKLWDASSGQVYLIDSGVMAYEAFTGLTQPSIPPIWTSRTTFGLLNIDTMASGNQHPVIEDQSFTVREDGVNGHVIGTVSASDADGDVLHYAITAGNTDGVFAIDSQSGQMTISHASLLDSVTTPTYTLTVEVSDAHQASDTATVTIDVIQSGSGSNPPVVNNQTFYLYDDSANGTLVGVVSASDPDGDSLLFTITAGDSSHAFALAENTGHLMVNDRYQLNYHTTRVYNLVVEVSDGTLTDTATVTVNLRRHSSGGPTNHAPSIQNQTFSIDAPVTTGAIVGTVVASDSDSNLLIFTITAGNGDGWFAIDRNTGRITVHDTTGLTAGNAYPLNVRVSDGQLSDVATVTITVNESGVGGNQPPDAPVLQSPANGQTGVAGSPVLTTRPFTDPDGNDTHGATHWQVSRTDDFSTLVFEVISDTDLTSINSPDLTLNAGSVYYWRARFFDTAGAASPWSDIVMFETAPAANQAPTADAGPDRTARPGETVTLDGSGSTDPDGTIVSYSWQQVSGTAVGLSSNGANATFTAPETDADGEAFVFELTVTDAGNLQSVDTCIVNVSLNNSPPIADAGVDHTVTEGTTVILDASRSYDPDGEIASLEWTQVSLEPKVTLSDPTAINPTFVQPVPPEGTTFRFRVTVEDGGGLMSSDDVEVLILDNGITRYANDILSFTAATGEQMGIQAGDDGRIISLDSVDPQTLSNIANRPEGALHGSIDTIIRVDTLGGVVTVQIYLPEPADDDLSWFRYSDLEGWVDYTANVTYNAERNRIEMILADGGIEDADEMVNGFIRIRLIFTGAANAEPDPSPNSGSGGGGGAGCYIHAAMAKDASCLSASAVSAWLALAGLVALGVFRDIRKKPTRRPDA